MPDIFNELYIHAPKQAILHRISLFNTKMGLGNQHVVEGSVTFNKMPSQGPGSVKILDLGSCRSCRSQIFLGSWHISVTRPVFSAIHGPTRRRLGSRSSAVSVRRLWWYAVSWLPPPHRRSSLPCLGSVLQTRWRVPQAQRARRVTLREVGDALELHACQLFGPHPRFVGSS